MPDKKMDIDSFFRQRYQQLPPGTDADSDWAQMNGLLDRRPPRLRKKTTRRIIRYLGGLALVTTVTWYAVKQYRQPAQRYQPLAVSHAQAPTAAAPPHLPIQSKAPTTATRPPKPTGRRRTVHRVWSDTILLASQRQVAQQKNNPPQPLSEQVAAQPPLASTATLNNWLQQLATPTVSFRINPLRDTVLHCPQGTVIYVPAFAFFNTQRKLVETRPLSLFVKECYQYSDMVANRLSTTTPHDLLTTGGMLHLSAVADSGQIQSVLFRTLAIQMPMRQYDPAMQLYLPIGGQANGSDRLDWETAGQVQAYMNAQPYQPSTSVKLMSMQQRITKGEKNNRHYFEVQTLAPLSEQQIKSLLRERYPLLSGKIDILVQEQEAHSDALKGSLARATRKGFVMQDSIVMPFDQAWQKGLLGRRDSLAYADWRRQDSLAWRNRIVQDSLAFVKRIQFERAYRFNVGSLGWINCDRLMAPPQVPRVQFVLRCTTTPPTLGLYHLLFTNQQGIVKGQYRQGEIYFGNLPEGFAAQLICVYQQGDQVMSCVRPVRIGQQMPTDLVFSATSPERFKQQLAAMDPALVGFDEPRPITDLPGR